MTSEACMGKFVSNLVNSTRFDFRDLQAFWGFGYEFKQLQQTLSAIAELEDIQELAYQVDDLLSHLAYQTTRFKILTHEVCFSRPSLDKVVITFQLDA
ncbi:hypothetical protein M5689_002253 [Euphorbia peplus]|nr:hypothetical protein M5689_002253 [Euphorbia peplus]